MTRPAPAAGTCLTCLSAAVGQFAISLRHIGCAIGKVVDAWRAGFGQLLELVGGYLQIGGAEVVPQLLDGAAPRITDVTVGCADNQASATCEALRRTSSCRTPIPTPRHRGFPGFCGSSAASYSGSRATHLDGFCIERPGSLTDAGCSVPRTHPGPVARHRPSSSYREWARTCGSRLRPRAADPGSG